MPAQGGHDGKCAGSLRMSITLAAFIYLLIWWTMLFTVLPLGVERHKEHGKGFDAGAPAKPDLKKKLILNSILSAVVLGIIQILVVTGVIDWRALFENAWK
jgi:predicted secreted protein